MELVFVNRSTFPYCGDIGQTFWQLSS